MDADVATWLVESGAGDLYENYSGRSISRRPTTGVVIDDWNNLLVAVVDAMETLGPNAHGDIHFLREAMRDLRVDNLGRRTIVY